MSDERIQDESDGEEDIELHGGQGKGPGGIATSPVVGSVPSKNDESDEDDVELHGQGKGPGGIATSPVVGSVPS
jgi:hypothetical protein